MSRGVIRWAHILREGAWLRMRIVESECSLAVYAEVEVLGWGFAASSGIRIRGRCRFVFLGHRRRLEKLVRGDGRIYDENEPRRKSWFVFVTYCVSLPLPGASLLFLQPTLEVPSSFSSSSCSSSYRCVALVVVVDLPMLEFCLRVFRSSWRHGGNDAGGGRCVGFNTISGGRQIAKTNHDKCRGSCFVTHH
jgi:hypothetical protein